MPRYVVIQSEFRWQSCFEPLIYLMDQVIVHARIELPITTSTLLTNESECLYL